MSSTIQPWSIPGASSALSDANSALGAYQGAASGTPQGYARAAINTGKLAGNMGAFGGNNSTINQGFGDAANALGIYSGIKQGGVSGYGGAAVNAAQLGSKLGAFGSSSGTVGQLAGYAAIPLDLYNEVNNWKSGATGSDALSGAETGAAIGSVIPGVGTVIGGLVGGAAGALSSLIGPGAKDPETYGWGALTGAYNQAGKQGGASAQQDLASSVQNPYEALAGMFDLHNGQVDKGNTLYNEFGRMGEQNFTNQLVDQLNQAKSSGAINPNMDASQIYSSVVQPWEDSWGKGQNTDPNAGLTKDLVTQMISQYESGQAANDWRAVGGDAPFANIYQGAPQTWGASAKTQATPQATSMAKSPTLDRLGVPMAGYADGGRARRKSILDEIRPNFAEAQHFDDGGSAYSNYIVPVDTGYSTFNNQDIYPSTPNSGPGVDVNNLVGSGLSQGDYNTSPSDSSTSSSGSSGSGLSSLLGGVGSLAKTAAPIASLLPIISALANRSGSGSASLPSGQSTGPTQPYQAQSSPRTMNKIDPNTDWYTYGQHPEQQFYSNNSIGPLMGSFVANQGQPSMQMPAPTRGGGQMTSQPVGMGNPRPIVRARGGALDHVEDGTPMTVDNRYVTGPGDGQSDNIDAKLSNGEYVMDAHTVSMLGNGSNEAGAKRLDEMRANLRKAAAKPMAKGKQFMKAKPPEAYLGGGKKKPLAFDVEGEG